nr:uncharacterized protein LOC127330203 [Lolium perenne]
MSVRLGLGDAAGDSGSPPVAARPRVGRGGLAGRGAAEARFSWLGGSRGKFWALEELGDGELGAPQSESEEEVAEHGQGEEPSRPVAPTLGGFICRAEELVGSLRHRRRAAFAPGGKGSIFGGRGPPRFQRLGDAAGMAAGGMSGRAARTGSAPPELAISVEEPSRATEGQVLAAAAVRPQLGAAGAGTTVVCPAVVGRGLAGARVSAQGAANLSISSCPVGVQFDGLGRRDADARPSSTLSGPREALEGPTRMRVFRWLWMPAGCLDPKLGFPARSQEVRQRLNDPFAPPHRLLRRVAGSSRQELSYVEAVMAGGFDDGRKRRFEVEGGARRFGGDSGGRRFGSDDGEQRGRFEGGSSGGGSGYRYREEEQSYREQRGREDWSSPPPWWREQQRREGELRDQRRGPAEGGAGWGNGGRPGSAGQGDHAGAGQRAPTKAKAKNKGPAVAGGAVTASQKSKNKAVVQRSGVSAGGECFKCGKEGHFQSDCTYEPLCVICSREGHTSASCLTRGKGLRLMSMGHAITGGGFFNIDVEPLRASQGASEVFTAVIKFDKDPLTEESL